MDNEKKAFREIIELLRIFPPEVVSLVPKDLIVYFLENMDQDYECHFELDTLDLSQTLEETKDIFTALFLSYWSTDEQCAKLLKYYQNKEKQNQTTGTTKFSTSEVLKKIHDEKTKNQ